MLRAVALTLFISSPAFAVETMRIAISESAEQAKPDGPSLSFGLDSEDAAFTSVSGASFDNQRGMWRPQYGAPYSERLPPMQRIDLSLSRVVRLSGQTVLVYFASLNNVLDRLNVYQYSYNASYTQRVAVPSLFNRSVYVGGSITHLPN